MTRVIVLGGRGMLGQAVAYYLSHAGHNVWVAGRPEMSILELASMETLEGVAQPEVVINCAGAIPERVSDSIEMIRVNALAPWIIRTAFKHARVIHISTDCVFNGDASLPYAVTMKPDATSVYGRTKALGECPDNVNIRCSFLGVKHGLLKWFLDQPNGAVIEGWANAAWNGGTVFDIAEALPKFFYESPGIYHLAGTPISKLQLLCRLAELFHKDVSIISTAEPFVNRLLNPTHVLARDLEGMAKAMLQAHYAG